MVKAPMTAVHSPFLERVQGGSAVLSAERTASPLKKQQGGFLRPANFSFILSEVVVASASAAALLGKLAGAAAESGAGI
jgi:hypothetical protein